MNKKLYLRMISIFLCLAIIVGLVNPVTAYAEEKAYLKVQKKIQEQYSQGVSPEDIFESLSEAEINTLVNFVSSDTRIASFSVIDIQDDPEAMFIDALAQEYYEYYQENGCFPEEKDGPTSRYYISASSTSSIISNIGYSFTNSQIAQQLVILGNLIVLGAPVLFSHLLTIVLGLAIVVLAVAILYCAVGTAANNQVGVWYTKSLNEIVKSHTSSATIAAQYQSNTKYWRAGLVDYNGLGGILVYEPISFQTAQTFVRNDSTSPNSNIFCVQLADALSVTSSVNSGGHYGPEAHRDNGKIMNHQHIHSRLLTPNQSNSLHGNVHIFFAIPYCQ